MDQAPELHAILKPVSNNGVIAKDKYQARKNNGSNYPSAGSEARVQKMIQRFESGKDLWTGKQL